MITLYGFDTANTIKIVLLLEELETGYAIRPVNIRQGANREPDFLALNPLGKIPVLVDSGDGGPPVTITESAAILIYLAEKSGGFLPKDEPDRSTTLQWLMVQAASCGPIFGQSEYWHHLASQENPAAIAHYAGLSSRILDDLDRHLANHAFFAGEDYTIADMAHFGWMSRRKKAGLAIGGRQNLRRWYDTIRERPATRRALNRVYGLPGAGPAMH